MKEFIEKLIGRLEHHVEYNEKMLEMFPYMGEVENTIYRTQKEIYESTIRIVKDLSEEYMTCYKSCTECEAYDKEKHHCPKFCYIIAETVKEIEENHNGWIPCSERLPEESLNSVIGWDEYRNRCCFVQYYGGRWILGNDIESVKVIAWMPLPEPYQKAGEADD